MSLQDKAKNVAPPRGERGLKYYTLFVLKPKLPCRSPSWGAWIEMIVRPYLKRPAQVAPPRGERGLKYFKAGTIHVEQQVAPPRGERGLKFEFVKGFFKTFSSLPLVGSVD